MQKSRKRGDTRVGELMETEEQCINFIQSRKKTFKKVIIGWKRE